MTTKTQSLHIRWMLRRDMREVLKIENESFEFPWSERDFIGCLRQRNVIGMVATGPNDDELIVGFRIYAMHKFYLELLNLCVARDVRRRGVGSQMIDELIGKLTKRRPRLWFNLWELNVEGQRFLSAKGFRAVRVLRDHYDEGIDHQDAYRFQYRKSVTIP